MFKLLDALFSVAILLLFLVVLTDLLLN